MELHRLSPHAQRGRPRIVMRCRYVSVSIHDVTDPEDIRLLDVLLLNPGADASAEYEPEGIELVPGRELVVVSNPEAGVVSLIELRAR